MTCSSSFKAYLEASSSLPTPGEVYRWVPSRKLAILAAIRAGALAIPDATAKYGISLEELLEWTRAYEDRGLNGLKVYSRPIKKAPEAFKLRHARLERS